ncbi:C6 zinc finger domain protein [Neofusicoccum parvum]|uniref:C6 zinc finger domain protein n=1 Tax=Neofusicoccum parvum TaxID=310453 RepID=A0ACB5S9X9_9PEZI|nr:C6 zinc finger domain protein [Neofusicoccum parvum]
MPRRKAAERSQPHKSRSRSGCLTCRKRKIRCDEARPQCANCRDKGLQCLRGVTLKWEQEYASRGLAFGRCGVWSKHGGAQDDVPRLDGSGVHWLPLPLIQPFHFVNSTVDGFEDALAEQDELSWFSVRDDGFLALAARPGSSSSSVSGHSAGGTVVPYGVRSPRSPPPLLHSPRDFPQLENPAHAPLLHYYLERLCPLTTPSARAHSPFASLILPFSVQASSTALNSVLALSARHLSRMQRAWKPVAMQLEGKVLHSLRRRLITEAPERVALDPEVPTIMMLLCLYEIINKCDERWVVHLRGARDLIRTRRRLLPSSTTPNDALLTFSERFFAYQDVIGRTACGEVPIFGAAYWDAADAVADAWLGCSPQLVAVVSAITELSRQRRSAAPAFAVRAAALESRLADVRQLLPDAADAALARSAEAKRLAAVVYLYCALHGAHPRSPLVRRLVRRVLRFVADAVRDGAPAGLTWPLFVAAVELDPLDDEVWEEGGRPVYGRPLVLEALSHMAKSSIANVGRMRGVVSKVWELREREVAGSPGAEGEDERNDWERLVAPLCINMSLVG